jgi:ubiquinone/menaquinone biosynthesis C-methylase UbiE
MKNPENIKELYSGEDIPVLFKAGFINFGYWNPSSLEKDEITIEEFENANKALYQSVFDLMAIKSTDRVLEVGSGFGAGCALAANLYHPQSVVGIDYFQDHVARSIKLNQKSVDENKLSFLRGKVENLPIPSQTIDKLFTVEAFQHFIVEEAIGEFARVLVSGGVLAISTFFALKKDCFKEILHYIPRPAVLSDKSDEQNAALPEVLQLLKVSGFKDIEVTSIGEDVWQGYDKWVGQNNPGIWDRNWLIAYRAGLLDYFTIKAIKKG